MRLISEPEFFARLKEKLDQISTRHVFSEQGESRGNEIRSVMGPGRSGAIASVYASHYLGAVWLPAAMKLVPQVLRPVLVIDTATQSGASLRKIANRVKADYQLAVFEEPPRVRFWYEEQERPGLEVVSYGGKCETCGFEYREYQGHIIPCPRCGADLALEVARRFGGNDGDHHKAWVIDQMCRALLGPEYEKFVAEAKAGEDGPETYGWDTGIAP